MTTIALVTGANRGIGNAIAEQLAGLGTTVLVAGRDLARCSDAAAAIGPGAHPVLLDVTVQATVDTAADLVRERFGRLDILVNNAGISGRIGVTPSAADIDDVHAVFDTNVFGVIKVTNAMLPLLLRSPAGRVVNVSSSVGSMTRMSDPAHYFAALPAMASYPPAKSALNSLTVQYAKELRARGILVNAADPGACATDFTRPLGITIDRTADQGAAIAVRLATLPADGPTGRLFNDDGPIPW
ncbi:SDR family NAD(P)-dependent oxidoreductase [Actinomadura sp. HBU206391]|uniref:SDR family NAD(P)-dependent oxidoreductase n=1 Tax=Actinomadura sp. HBU206391 TaxID=2731692 RepID=UPI00165065B0|nr:SDR family NAD(P)-dependent oxidoreductase [Actinomadura sp. HBU206391]MBC6457071.1 SDR family NAD(P)-dependent oxidoreductase [Actinomadura sp. HBU206391]